MKGIIIIDVPIDDTVDFGHFDIRADVIVKGYENLDFQSYLVEHAEVNPIPQKKDAFEECMKFDMMTGGKVLEEIVWQVNGYNYCIDEILGEKE